MNFTGNGTEGHGHELHTGVFPMFRKKTVILFVNHGIVQLSAQAMAMHSVGPVRLIYGAIEDCLIIVAPAAEYVFSMVSGSILPVVRSLNRSANCS